MTEKEKMLNQMIYDANYDKELLAERQKAKSIISKSAKISLLITIR